MLEGFPGQRLLVHGAQHGLNRHAAGDFTRSRATHAVANHKVAAALLVAELQPVRIFVAFPGSPLIGRAGCLVFQHSLLFVWHLLFL